MSKWDKFAKEIYTEKCKYMSEHFKEVNASDFYATIFPFELMETKGDTSVRSSNPIFGIIQNENGKQFFQNEIVFQNHYEDSLKRAEFSKFALCSMCSYSGRRRTAKNAYRCHGFSIDLDGVGVQELKNLFGWIEGLKKIPNPTFIVNSGHGVHVYYVFESPVPLYPRVREHLQRLKHGLTSWVWNKETSSYDVKDRQYQGIYQSYRMVGSLTKIADGDKKYTVRSWQTGGLVTIDYLNQFVEDEYKCPTNPDYSSWDWAEGTDHYTLEECKTLFPEWYEKRIVNGEPSGQWKNSRGLYEWWLEKLQTGAKDGNRYHCISVLYVFAIKCMIPKDVVDADAADLIEPLNALTVQEGNEFTAKDVEAASKFYQPKFVRMTRKEIERRTGIRIEPARRNGRKQSQHLQIARFTQSLQDPDGSWRNKEGAPSKSSIVQEWQKKHPDGTRSECIKDTGLSKPTVLKWWNVYKFYKSEKDQTEQES